LTLVRRVAEALAVAHGRGVVHGGLRPSKLLLREGRVEGVTLLDYGISANLAESTVTGTQELIASLCYLAPEQARGERPGPSADIYSLGGVLFECLTGRPPLRGEHVATVLAQMLYEELPRLGPLRPDLPAALEALLARMLAKPPGDRIADGQALVAALRDVSVTAEQGQTLPGTPESGALMGQEQRLMSVILAIPPSEVREAADGDGGAVGTGPDAGLMAKLEQTLRPYGAQVEGLAGGVVIMVLSQPLGTAMDQMVQAARAAQAVRPLLGGWSMSLVSGRGTLSGAQLLGEAMQRAVELLAAHTEDERRAGGAPPLWLDDLTAGLLDSRFIVRRAQDGWVLDRERMGGEVMRLLLGRRTPYVGRERELELLAFQLRSCAAESVARGMLVLAPSGVGKSRLWLEFLRRVEDQEERVTVLLGRGDPMHGNSAYSLLGQVLLEHCQLDQATGPGPGTPGPGDDRRRRFAEVVGRRVAERDRQQVVEFLGEICGLPFPDDHSPQLRAARQDPRFMSDQVTAAWLKLLGAECAAHPVLLVLEDLHWSDRATLRLVEAALRELAEARLMVLAFARPELKEMFPGLWQDAQVQTMWLPVLGARASELLVREMLGDMATDEVVARIVKQAGGNALFLEELIRAAAEGREGQPSETVLAMLQARIGGLEPGMRRVLEVASVMGETFWRGGVLGLLGAEGKGEKECERCLRALVGAEMIVQQKASRFAGEMEYVFRHALMREAAYGLLAEEDRSAGHRLVGEYLERMGERALMVLAEHFRLGGDARRAAGYFAQAAIQAMQASDHTGTLLCVERGIACGAEGETLGALRAAEAWAQFWSGDFAATYAAAMASLTLLPPGSDPWVQAIGPLMGMVGYQGQRDALVGHARAFIEAPLAARESTFVESAMHSLFWLCLYGERELTGQTIERLREVGARLQDNEVRARGLFYTGLLCPAMMMDGDYGLARTLVEQSLACFVTVGDRRFVTTMRGHLAFTRALLGEAAADVQAEFRTVLALLTELQEMILVSAFRSMFALALAQMGEPSYLAEGEALAEQLLASNPYPGFWTGLANVVLAEVWAARGELQRAEEAVRRALPVFVANQGGKPLGCAVLGRILLGQGRLGEALAAVKEGQTVLQAIGGTSLLDTKLHLAAAEIHQAAENPEAAREALAAGARLIEWRAAQIPEGAARERFRTGVRYNARLLELLAAR
jgi:hypothetical protein